MPDPAALPEAYEGVLWRRTLAYFVDLCVIGVIAVLCWIVFAVLWVLSFGLLGPVLWFLFGLIPLAYHTLLLSGPRVGHRRYEALRCRAALGDRGAARVLAGADTDCLLLYNSRGDLLADPAAGSIQPAQAHIARHAGRHRSRAALPGPLGHRATPVARLIRWPLPAC